MALQAGSLLTDAEYLLGIDGDALLGNVLIYYYSNYPSFFTEAWIRVYDGTDLMLANPFSCNP